MLVFPNIDPIALHLGNIQIYWYGLLHVLALMIAWCYLRWQPRFASLAHEFLDILACAAVGMLIGGRLGYVLIYQPVWLQEAWWRLLTFWEPGRSFHGGLVGVCLAIACYSYYQCCRQAGALPSWWQHYWQRMDALAVVAPLGLLCGRLGNFCNGELWGKIADPSLPWAMYFPGVDAAARHPSQLYEAALEGLLLFLLLQVLLYRTRWLQQRGRLSASFLWGYGLARFVAEYWREPDTGLLYAGLQAGQWLSLPMWLLGLAIWYGSTRACKST